MVVRQYMDMVAEVEVVTLAAVQDIAEVEVEAAVIPAPGHLIQHLQMVINQVMGK